ncbi:nuclear GTPase SLIP-GC-like, partial [Neolamprologus brichardi]|uniref:nuclear GTPase SLIP-GC-like n=1 Tax=Neolamprologus brichardi TaxID=32507 RepID=UPI001643DCDF
SFIRKKISDLETDKRELVGVFGKTGAGKSSLINAIIEEKNLLPSGSINACTSVMIKVEANTHNKYEAEIEFITKEEWKDELWSFHQLLDNNENQEKEDDDDYRDAVEKLSALYGEEWKEKSSENLMENKYFKEIPEFLQSRRKILRCESANELSAKCVKYTRSDSKQGEGNEGKKWFWPLVKCVTVRVPNNPFLQHVTLVDLPGNGDCNKSRDQMWKGIVGDCSIVWIVTEINRAASEKEAWEILESVSSLIGNDDKKAEVCAELERNTNLQLRNVNKEMEDTYTAFEKYLDDGVEKSKGSYGEKLKNFLYRGKKGGAFHKVLKCVVKNGGVYKPKKGTLINLNMKLASCLIDSIDDEFRKTFPNDSEHGAFNGVIDTFSLNTDSLFEKYKNAELQLRFLKTEEEKIKAKLNRMMRKQKKRVYSSLTETIEDIMDEGYKKAAEFSGKDTLYNMRETITDHVHSKEDMFERAKNTMLEKLHSLMEKILKTLEETMKESIERSFKTDGGLLPDVSTELEMVKKHYDKLVGTPDDETSLTGFADQVETAETWTQTGLPRGSAV